MAKKIISVGFEIPGDVAEYIPLRSNRSLLDADIVVFSPQMKGEYYISHYHQGKPRLGESDSFKVVGDAAHWRSEIQMAFNTGKTIMIYLTELTEYFVETGAKGISGTGRSKTNITYVSEFNNYAFLPITFEKIISSSGKSIKFAKDTKFLTSYWKAYEASSSYEVILEGGFETNSVILVTKTGNKAVGLHLTNGKGNMVLLPDLSYPDQEFISSVEGEDGEIIEEWTPEAVNFGKKLLSHIVEIDKSLQVGRILTPFPEWTRRNIYRLPRESDAEKEIQKVSIKIEELEQSRIAVTKILEDEGKLRHLLYETGHPLEEAILEALRLMGFTAETYKDSESEFDAVFLSPEGRFLGEAEGKDQSAINIDKLSQLERNLQEDFQKDDVEEYAHGVLFGNAYRLEPPHERQDFFTEKCLSGAVRAGISLVRTIDLFEAARYLKGSQDKEYAQKCREAIFTSKDKVVAFPKSPIETVVSQDEVSG